MLRVTIELLPGGDAHHRQKLGVMNIGNANPKPGATKSDYHVAWISGAETDKPIHRATMVKDIPRPSANERREWEFLKGVLNALSL